MRAGPVGMNRPLRGLVGSVARASTGSRLWLT